MDTETDLREWIKKEISYRESLSDKSFNHSGYTYYKGQIWMLNAVLAQMEELDEQNKQNKQNNDIHSTTNT